MGVNRVNQVDTRGGWSPGVAVSPSEEVRLLTVDDRADNLDVLAALLEQPGVQLLRASSGEEALELLLQHEVALALIDVRMPTMDGFELAELMRGAERTRQSLIIFVTAATPESVRVFEGYEAGAVDSSSSRLIRSFCKVRSQSSFEFFRQRQQLAGQIAEHKKLVQMSELLIGVLSHDLRAPLSAVVTAGELLPRMYPDDERIGQIAGRIRSSSKRMTRLIEQLLDFATARLGQLPIKPQPTNLNELCETAVAEFQERSDSLRCLVVGDPVGTWDPDRLLQLLANLIGNAVQHGAADAPITVRIEGGVDATIQIQVENGGVIPPEIRESLFSPFVRSTGSSSGAGLGLFIVDQIARAHGGQVAAHCPGDTTISTVRLPRHYQ